MNHSTLMFLGLGLVDRSLLKMILEEGFFLIEEIRVSDLKRRIFDHPGVPEKRGVR